MVGTKHMWLRPAIAMIELIFAIVIMGIVMMSAPMLISTATQSTYVAMQQEGINEAATQVSIIMGYAWDENDTDDTYAPILHVTAGASDLAEVATTARRKGTPNESQRTFIFADANTSNLFATTVTALGSDGAGEVPDDVDDFIGDISLTQIGGTASVDYIEKTTVNINTTVGYISDTVLGGYQQSTITFVPGTGVAGTSNIKEIVVTLTSTDTANADVLAKNIVLRAFSCNIGAYQLEERTF